MMVLTIDIRLLFFGRIPYSSPAEVGALDLLGSLRMATRVFWYRPRTFQRLVLCLRSDPPRLSYHIINSADIYDYDPYQ